MKILIDMNLSPQLSDFLAQAGWDAKHWSTLGSATAADRVIMEYASQHGYVVLSHDLDFSAMLAATQATKPSVIQIRTQDVLSERFNKLLLDSLNQFQSVLEEGALVVIDDRSSRARVLPLR